MPSLWLDDMYECPNDKQRQLNYDTNTFSCSCEPHCSWDKCRLFQAPKKCLDGTRSVWLWDNQRKYWVAQEVKGEVTFLTR